MKKSKRVHDCPNLDSIQRKERQLIKTMQEIREKKREQFKVREGIPPFKPKPLINGDGCSHENGIPVVPKLDGKVRRKRAEKK